jgi:IS30 family transposase
MFAYHQLTQEERYRIAAERSIGSSLAQIAGVLGRHPSTIGRELARNATAHDGAYRPEKAQSYATARRRRCRRRAQFSAQAMAKVCMLLRKKWSAEQISGTLKETDGLRISHETIYRRIRWDKKIGGSLWRHTRIMSKFGRKRYRSHDSRGVLPGKRPIGERPAEVEGRQRIGHWEGDTVMGSDKRHCVLTLLERKTGYAIIKKLKARTKDEVTRAATRAIASHCRKLLHFLGRRLASEDAVAVRKAAETGDDRVMPPRIVELTLHSRRCRSQPAEKPHRFLLRRQTFGMFEGHVSERALQWRQRLVLT